MLTQGLTQRAFVNLPKADWFLFSTLAKKFGWQVETDEQLLDSFISSRPVVSDITEDDIVEEVRSNRYSG